jgi:hypothetical protein
MKSPRALVPTLMFRQGHGVGGGGTDKHLRVMPLSSCSGTVSQEKQDQDNDQQECSAADIHFDSFRLLHALGNEKREMYLSIPYAARSVRWRTNRHSGLRSQRACGPETGPLRHSERISY